MPLDVIKCLFSGKSSRLRCKFKFEKCLLTKEGGKYKCIKYAVRFYSRVGLAESYRVAQQPMVVTRR